ncbi:energy transducer TonB [Flavobacterium sp.]|uniref:energy transducer TonB n=1 Tax=Flavobacterium sp. TaxID=239 RepID=UPI0038FC6FE8
MSKLSIYETGWINLVFENRNKEYGAYQLRQDYVKSSLTALFIGVLLVTSLGLLLKFTLSSQNLTKPEIAIPPTIDNVLTVTRVYITERKKNILPEVKSQTTEVPITKDNLINPKIVHSTEPLPEITTNKELTNQSTTASDAQGTTAINPYSGSSGGEFNKPSDFGNTVVKATALDKLPEFPGGISKFYSYVGTNFEKPEIENSESIRVIVNFIIEKDGSMTDIQVRNNPGYGLAKEAIRVLKSLKTKWTPGIINSKAVRTAYSLPISIQLD